VGLVSGFVGARLLHVVFEEPEFYLAHPVRMIEIWTGGFVFFGGLIGAWAGVTIFCQMRKEPLFLWLYHELLFPYLFLLL
jgi:phosphatidylglycerol:prolipoprotein diacylglycerol transferase